MAYQQNAFFSIANKVVVNLQSRFSSVRNFFELREENARLHLENKQLLENSISTFRKIEGDFVLIEDSIWKRQYRLLSAEVINGTLYQSNNYFTINKGSVDGVEKKKGVISAQGIVGRVVAVSEYYCIVESIISENFSTGAYVKRTGNLGYLKWNNNPFETNLTQVVITAPIAIGDMVYSKAGSGYFPPDTKVGEIVNLKETEGEAFYEIDIQLSTDFSKLNKVFIVTNEYQEELNALQENYYP